LITRFFLLDWKGLVCALVLGGIVVIFSKGFWAKNLFLLVSFLLLGVFVTKYKHKEKREKGLYEHERGWENVFSNGLVPGVCIILFYFFGEKFIFSYVCSVAAVTSDKFASELGVLSEKPISLKNLKRVKQGTSGAISGFGTFMAFVGSTLIGAIAYFLYKFDPFLIFYVSFAGLVGCFFDSFAGILEEEGIGSKSTSNIICSIVGAALGLVVNW
jgi:uncharacterized protein (TIGR00297 family)